MGRIVESKKKSSGRRNTLFRKHIFSENFGAKSLNFPYYVPIGISNKIIGLNKILSKRVVLVIELGGAKNTKHDYYFFFNEELCIFLFRRPHFVFFVKSPIIIWGRYLKHNKVNREYNGCCSFDCWGKNEKEK